MASGGRSSIGMPRLSPRSDTRRRSSEMEQARANAQDYNTCSRHSTRRPEDWRAPRRFGYIEATSLARYCAASALASAAFTRASPIGNRPSRLSRPKCSISSASRRPAASLVRVTPPAMLNIGIQWQLLCGRRRNVRSAREAARRIEHHGGDVIGHVEGAGSSGA